MRRVAENRSTSETSVRVELDLDGAGRTTIATGVPFLDHMLNAFARHGHFDLDVEATGDLEVDAHHTVEDIGIVLGTAIGRAIGEGRGIRRFGHAAVPMDEALAEVALDCGGRAYLVFDAPFNGPSVGGIDVTLLLHFFESLCGHAGITLHVRAYGRNDHHRVEAIFKAVGVALRAAVALDGESLAVPSTKGVL
ncbi:MAG TPA: imidazoleglycerol-phosphate dehydratase HisB [Methanoregulaceae archaeon]|nr:imidazoleglycerol-phosphate dehydratase HisB [Methanoregulaceae archaeon]HOV68056.1 imidazoleglycerol-phosphate dehydratase HisB [Methanoregulaceae archaeon]HQJ87055.1 imidazoleglycerol-phosphate dehydratase HisB [Methanoregulaceae archaeon]